LDPEFDIHLDVGDPVEYEHVEVWRQVQRRPETLDESDRAVLTALNSKDLSCPHASQWTRKNQ
jgi:hypothetical protein